MLLALMTLGVSCSGCSSPDRPEQGKPDEPAGPEEQYDAYAYVTIASRASLMREMGLKYADSDSKPSNLVKLTGEEYQSVEGFGAAISVASCYNLLKMPQEDRTAFLKEVFDPSVGMGSSLVRVCIGGSDFSYDYGASGTSPDGRFTWCDAAGMENFAPHGMDVKYVVAVLKEICAINPDVKIIGSPWTAPVWMKEKPSWTGSHLKKEYYSDYAQYFVKWIQYMEGQGFDVYAVTTQNEPLNPGNSMSMLQYWDECRDFVKVLGPAFEAAGLDTRILIFDHNYNYDGNSSQTDYPLKVYADKEAARYIAGSAWHNYGGSVSELDQIVREAPDKEIYFTEASIGSWNYSFESCLVNDFRDIFIGTLSRGCRGVTLWNLMLDDKNGPFTAADGSCTTCYGAVTVLTSDYRTIERRSQYYHIAHCSKVIRPGAVRLGTEGFTKTGVSYLAFRNPDGSKAVIVLNENGSGQQLVFAGSRHRVKFSVPARAIVSLYWKD